MRTNQEQESADPQRNEKSRDLRLPQKAATEQAVLSMTR
jgi:hypothetical protein